MDRFFNQGTAHPLPPRTLTNHFPKSNLRWFPLKWWLLCFWWTMDILHVTLKKSFFFTMNKSQIFSVNSFPTLPPLPSMPPNLTSLSNYSLRFFLHSIYVPWSLVAHMEGITVKQVTFIQNSPTKWLQPNRANITERELLPPRSSTWRPQPLPPQRQRHRARAGLAVPHHPLRPPLPGSHTRLWLGSGRFCHHHRTVQ